jgi:hypothetical protein
VDARDKPAQDGNDCNSRQWKKQVEVVMAGLGPPTSCFLPTDVDARDKPAHDGDNCNLRAHTLIGLSCFPTVMNQCMSGVL